MRTLLLALLLLTAPLFSSPARAYSVLAHEAMVDAAWNDVIAPMLRRRFPQTTADGIRQARAYAYGGSVIQDLGYYPFGSHLFTNLLHYVRSGDFVEALLREARDVNEFAFALGALAHYTSDIVGHPNGVNVSVPLIYPKLRARHGPSVTYDDDPKRHIMVEFSFDVVQVGKGAYLPESFREFIGFEVARPVLERAFRATYGLEVGDLFRDVDLAIGTFRYAVSELIPSVTRAAWRDKRDEIRVYSFTRRDYEREFGTSYRKPGFFSRFIVFVAKILPKVGPFAALAFRAPTPEAERLFVESFRQSTERYRVLLAGAADGAIQVANLDFDTGQPGAWGEYPLADETYLDLLQEHAAKNFATAPATLRADLLRYFAPLQGMAVPRDKKARTLAEEVRRRLAPLRASR